jgi:hypothetical protein
MSRAPLLLALFVLLLPVAAADDASFAPRLAVAALASDAQALVAWLPGDAPAESYNVYGLTPNGPVLLAATPAGQALVPAGFAAYAVSGVSGGVESPLVSATGLGGGEECITIGWDSHGPYVIFDCWPNVRVDASPGGALA